MTTYNTGNPIGSTDPRDLYDNAENLDNAVNTHELTWTDRLGVVRRSMAGATGYENLGDYAAGLEFTNYNQILRYSGEFYRVSASTSLPFTTTGVWATDEPSLVAIGDAVLRAEIGEGVRRVENLTTLKLVDGRFAGDIAYMTGRATTGDGGEGHFRWVTGDQSANVTADTQNGIWVPGTDGTGVGGAWERVGFQYLDVRYFGAKEETQNSFFPALSAAVSLNTGKTILIDGNYYGGGVNDSAITLTPNTPIKSASGSIISGIGQNGAFIFSSGNYDGTKFTFPTLTGFTGDVFRFNEANFAQVEIDSVTNEATCNAVNLFTGPSGRTLDNKITIHTANNIGNVVVVTGDALSVIQGHEIYVNFALSCLRGVLFSSPSSTDAPFWDGNKFVFQAIDAIGVANARAITNVSGFPVPRAIFRVESWLGGFDSAGVAWADGKFDETDFYIKIANDMANYDWWRVVGQGNRIDTGTSGFKNTTKTYAAVNTAGISGFNSGAPVQDSRFAVNYTTTEDLVNNQSLILYVYSPYADSVSDNFTVQPDSIPGLMLDRVAFTNNANEIQLIFRNVTGVTIPSGSVLSFYITVGH